MRPELNADRFPRRPLLFADLSGYTAPQRLDAGGELTARGAAPAFDGERLTDVAVTGGRKGTPA